MDTVAKDILESLEFIKDHMLTKDEGATKDDIGQLRSEMKADIGTLRTELKGDIVELKEDIADIRDTMATSRELAEIRREIEHLSEQFENVSGFRKEIDHALERIAVVERHVGLKR